MLGDPATVAMMVTSDELAARCAQDGEFCLAARYWSGGLRLVMGSEELVITLSAGRVGSGDPEDGRGVVTLRADLEVWSLMLSAVPPRFYTDVVAAQSRAGMTREGDELTYWQYLPAIQRAVELLRQPTPSREALPPKPPGVIDAPVGRYVHLELGGHDHRIYFEEAGQGIPLLLQHTAGSHGAQWRHLFEMPEIVDNFRLIAYDLPFHGKSVPPSGVQWWSERYQLTGEFVRSVPVQLSAVLGLDRPVFMGCSVGGLLALDLAYHHPDVFSAVISLEGALRVGGDLDALLGFWHPAVGNESKARMMEGLTSPTSPAAYRKETTQTYASGWPPAFVGDLQYYCVDYDLRDFAGDIDTGRVGVHLLTGEYDYSATIEHGRAAHEAIAGSTFQVMEGLGHFPMSEDPARFATYLLPVLDEIRTSR